MPYYDFYESRIGMLYLEASDKGISQVTIIDIQDIHPPKPNMFTNQAKKELMAYFSGSLKKFSIPIDFNQGTQFQQKVWTALLDIPYGATTTYLALSKTIGDVKAIRAVGAANGRNPIPIIVPCHRVIGSNGSLVGYALGIDVKSALLAIEKPQEFGVQGSLFD